MARVRQSRRYPNTSQRHRLLSMPSVAQSLVIRQNILDVDVEVVSDTRIKILYNEKLIAVTVPEVLTGVLLDDTPVACTLDSVGASDCTYLLDESATVGPHILFIPPTIRGVRSQSGGYIAGGATWFEVPA